MPDPKPRDGVTNTTRSEIGKPKNKMVSLLLCIFLGYFGAHKFYEGKILMGVLYFFTLGLFGIGWIVDIVMLAKKSKTYYISNEPIKKVPKWIIIAFIALMIIAIFSEDEPNENLEETETTSTEMLETEEAETISLVQNQETSGETTTAEDTELSEDEYKEQCVELFYDEVFFGEDLTGQRVKLNLFVAEAYYFTVDDMYSVLLREYFEKYDLNRDFFKCCVLHENDNSYMGRNINMWFNNAHGLEPSDYDPGDKIVVYADVVHWSDNTMDGYNSVAIIPRYIDLVAKGE